MTVLGEPEHVYVENAWYDGPRAGVADVNGSTHRFLSQFDENEDEYLGTFLVWPIDESELALEQEQWQIFAKWNEDYEAGNVDADSHPGLPGLDERWGEIDAVLERTRTTVPATAIPARADMSFAKEGGRYPLSSPAYKLTWKLL